MTSIITEAAVKRLHLKSQSTEVTINGIEQLEPPAGGSLHLAHLVLEMVEGGLLTVAALGERALLRADDPAGLRALLDRIAADTSVLPPLGAAARARVQRDFQWDAKAAQVIRIASSVASDQVHTVV